MKHPSTTTHPLPPSGNEFSYVTSSAFSDASVDRHVVVEPGSWTNSWVLLFCNDSDVRCDPGTSNEALTVVVPTCGLTSELDVKWGSGGDGAVVPRAERRATTAARGKGIMRARSGVRSAADVEDVGVDGLVCGGRWTADNACYGCRARIRKARRRVWTCALLPCSLRSTYICRGSESDVTPRLPA